MIFIGIDPGASGGIAVITHRGAVIQAVPMPQTEADILKFLTGNGEPAGNSYRATLEHVWSIPGQGGAFKFGRSIGHLQMALTAARIPYDQVLPKRWQKALGVVYVKGMSDTEKKNITKRRAQQLFPALNITHAIADALLMAEYCRRLHTGAIDGKEEGRSAQGHTEARGSRQPFEGYVPKGRTRSYRINEINALAAPTAAGAHPGQPHPPARQRDRYLQRSPRHNRD